METLDDYRREIDEIDAQLVSLFERRMNVVLKVAKYKKEHNIGVFQEGREQEVIKKAISRLENPDYEREVALFLKSAMDLSRSLQYRKLEDAALPEEPYDGPVGFETGKVGYPGTNGSFSEEALIRFFGNERERAAYVEFEDVFLALQKGEIVYGVLPVENSSTGGVSEAYDLLKKYDFYIVGEQYVKIDQHLMGIKGAKIEDIEEVYSHPQGIGQCSEFLKQYPDWKLIPFHNTAISAKFVKDSKDRKKAAIASRRASELYELPILAQCINNQKDNFTRFIVIGKTLGDTRKTDKVSVVFSLDDQAGTLYRLLRYIADNNINMTKIESRPMPKSPWQYFLYVDFECDINNPEVKRAISSLKENAPYFRLLGAYRKEKDE